MNKFEQELQDLITYFETAKYPDYPIRLNRYISIWSTEKFIGREAKSIREFKGSERVHDSLFKHLREFKEICVTQKQWTKEVI